MCFVIIDSRESELIIQSKLILGDKFDESVKIEALHLGDIMISDKIIIERKQWSDLASSIIDGRYKEQSTRLLQAKEEGYTIYYFLEGNLDLYKPYGISKDTLRSCVFSLTYEKGFYVVMSKSPRESIEYILKFKQKNEKYKSTPITNSIVSKKKNSQITKENISELMICQIPGISTTTSRILLTKFNSLQDIMNELNTNTSLFEDFTYLKDDKPKKLNKNIIEVLNHFLRK
jgi:Fanconi anemia group M protein